jgi:death-on-curing protein
MIIWIDRAMALAIHERQIAEHRGDAGIRDEALLESALARPQQLYAYGDSKPDLAVLAASLAFGLARNMAFIDGNKCAAHVCYQVFLASNGVRLDADKEEMYLLMLALAEGTLEEAGFAEWLRPLLRAR